MVAGLSSPLALVLALQDKLEIVADADIDWKFLVIAFSTAVYLLETYLTLRQYPMYDKKSPPDALSHKFAPDVFEKSQVYGRDKARFSLISSAYDQALEVLMLHYDAQAWAWTVAGEMLAKRGYEDYEIAHSILFLGVMLLLGGIPSLPVQYYQTFVLEQKHGFNKSTLGLFISDTLKGWALAAFIGGPFVAAFLWIIRWAGDGFIPWLMAFMVAFQLTMVILYPLVIQPLFNKLSPLPSDSPLRSRVETLATSLKFPLTDLYVIDGSKRSAHSNAYFYGLPWSKHIVIYDTLINQSTPEEIEAVLAHELGHWSYSHPLKLLLISQVHLFLILSAFPPFLSSRPLVKAFGFPSSVYNHKSGRKPPTLVTFMLFQMILTPFEALFKLGMNALSRHFEWQADQFALKLGRSPSDEKVTEKEDIKVNDDADDMGARLARALITLHVENLSTVWVDWLYSAYHYSHPTLTERLKAMDDYRLKNQASASTRSKKEL